MAKQLNQVNVSLAFTADTSKAKAQLQDLQRQLTNIVNAPTSSFGTGLATDIQKATTAAAELKVHLQNATNVNTGTLDFTKLNQSIKQSGTTLNEYANTLRSLGPTGQQAFMALAESVAQAEVPIKRSNALVTELWTSLKNTARWQFSSSVLHGFMGAIQGAVGYAKDLNESLNNIRIVTGYNTDKMAEFAEQANKAAKALSTTTTEYTNASLIYYQQGLSDEEVAKRTDITIKMANAAGVSAETVSDQLTAVWNNFYDGSKSLEYYADVMTALGAATASSTDEISEGLNKFAAVAETVGLSYEYATSALATVTATTRESADVVGTAFKTLFARIQGLTLGETLDDGTDLNKYSEALSKVGISIFETNGEMKAMDNILNELGTKWQTLGRDQQTALAQTVAGVRQYTQLVALMDNWDYFQENLGVATNASGALQKQADIYADSWQAASDRVKAALEGIYQDLLNDEAFIDVLNTIEKIVSGIDTMIDAVGGLNGVMAILASVLTKVFSKQMAQGLRDIGQGIKMRLPGGKEKVQQDKNAKLDQMMADLPEVKEYDTTTEKAYISSMRDSVSLYQTMLDNINNMSESEKKVNQILLDRNKILQNQKIESAKEKQKAEEKVGKEAYSGEFLIAQKNKGDYNKKQYQKDMQAYGKYRKQMQEAIKIRIDTRDFDKLDKDSEESRQQFAKLQAAVKKLLGSFTQGAQSPIQDVLKNFAEMGYSAENLEDNLNDLRGALNLTIAQDQSNLSNIMGNTDEAKQVAIGLREGFTDLSEKTKEYDASVKEATTSTEEIKEKFKNSRGEPKGYADAIMTATTAMASLGAAFSTVQGVIDVFNDSESTAGDKLLSLITGLGTLIPIIMGIAPAFSTATVGAKLFGKVVTETGAAAGVAMWQVTAIVLAITAIVAVIATLATQQSEAAKAAEKAAKTSEELNDNLAKTEEAANKLKDSFDGYETAIDKLKECTKGTQEWRDALQEVNSTALQVIDALPDNLSAEEIQSLYTRENGYIELDNEKIAQYQGQLNNAVNAANYAKSLGDYQNKKAQISQEAFYLAQDLVYKGEDSVARYVQNKIVDNLGSLTGLTNDELKKALERLGAETARLTDTTIKDAQIQIEKLATAAGGAEEKLNLITALQVEEQLGDDYSASVKTVTANQTKVRTKKLEEAYKTLAAANAGEQKEAADLLDYKGELGINQAATDDNAIYKFLLSQLQASGYDFDKAEGQKAVMGNDANREFTFMKDGKEEVYSAEAVAEMIAASQALRELGQSAEEASDFLSYMESNVGQEQGAMLNSYLANKDFTTASSENFASFYAEVAKWNPYGVDDGDISETDVAWYVDHAFGDGKDGSIAKSTAIKLGFESSEEATKAIYEALEGTKKAWQALEIDKTSGFKGISLGEAFGRMSLDAAKEIDSDYKTINLGPQGEKAGKDYINGLNKMIEDLNPEKQQEALSQLAKIDWSDWDALEKAEATMEALGVDIDTDSKYWQDFATKMRIAAGATPDFTQLKNDLILVSKTLKELEFGDTIGEEEYNALIKYKNEWEKFFLLQADGTRQFIGNSKSMVEATRESINQQRDALEKRKEAQEAWQSVGWGYADENGDWHLTDWEYVTGENIGTAENLLKAIREGGRTEKALGELGYNEENLSSIISQAKQGNQLAIDQLAELYSRINDFEEEDLSGIDTELNEMMASTATSIFDLNKMLAAGDIDQAAYAKQLNYLVTSGMMAAESIGDLYSIIDQGLDNEAIISYDLFAESLINLANNYSNCTTEAERFQLALQSGNEQTIEAAQEQLEAAITAGEMANKYNLTAEHIERYADELEASGEHTKANEKSLTQMAKDQLRYDRAVNAASEGMETWIEDLKVAEKTGHLVSETADQMAEAYGDLLDINGSELSAEFLQSKENLELMQKALEGDVRSYALLREAAGKDILARIGLDTTQWEEDFRNLQNMALAAENMELADIEAGTSLDNSAFLTGLEVMVNKAKMTAQEATDYLSSMGIDAEVITEPQTVTEVQGYNLVATPGVVTQSYNPGAAAGGMAEATYPTVTYEPVPVTTEKTIAGTALKITSASKSSGGNVKQKGSVTSGGGSNSKVTTPKKAATVHKSSVSERYKEINDKIDDASNATNKASKAMDALYGNNRLKQMREANKLLDDEIKLMELKRKEADAYLSIDQKALQSVADEANIARFTFDNAGNITNYEEIMGGLYNELNKAIKSANADGNATEAEQKVIDDIQERIDLVTEGINQYDTTKELFEDLNNDIQDKTTEWQDNNLEILNLELELDLEDDQKALENMEYSLSKLGDSFYNSAEAGEIMKSKLGPITQQLGDQKQHMDALQRAYDANEISQQAYEEGMRAAEDAIREQLNALISLEEEMKAYYGDTLSKASEELGKYTDRMEHVSEVLDHYKNMMGILGKEADYNAMGEILETQAKASEDQLKVSTANYEEMTKQAELAYQKLQEDPTNEILKANWEAAEQAQREAQSQMLADTEEWAEAQKAILENELSGLNQSLENALTGGTSFDQMNTALDRASSLQEEYLTTTNKIYETTKMMRTAQNAIDATNNTVAKNRLKNFINETQHLQDQTKLSQYELDIQQAKYDLLLAEIALEEAQNAKSTVRLQRDAEGNFGYVYTADQNKIAEAQQQFEDAQNSLYNLSLQGTNDYTQKYQQTLSEMYDTLTSLSEQYRNGEFESEQEYQNAVLAAQQYYYEQLENFADLYHVAVTTDSRAIEDAWARDFASMMDSTEEWKTAANDYVQETQDSFNEFNEKMKDQDGFLETLDEMAEKSQNLVEEVTKDGGVIDTMGEELTQVQNLTGGYANLSQQIANTVRAYEKLLGIEGDYSSEIEDILSGAGLGDEGGSTSGDSAASDSGSGSGSGSGIGSGDQNDGPFAVGDRVIVKAGTKTFASGVGMASWLPQGGDGKDHYRYVMQVKPDKVLIGINGDYTGWVRTTDLKRFNTGGYTGDWSGPSGKLGILDKKEVILNANDSENFLASLDLLRDIVSVIDVRAASAQFGGLLTSPFYGNTNNETLEQNVKIEATFPNVTNHSEIEEAFNNLINTASQYANR